MSMCIPELSYYCMLWVDMCLNNVNFFFLLPCPECMFETWTLARKWKLSYILLRIQISKSIDVFPTYITGSVWLHSAPPPRGQSSIYIRIYMSMCVCGICVSPLVLYIIILRRAYVRCRPCRFELGTNMGVRGSGRRSGELLVPVCGLNISHQDIRTSGNQHSGQESISASACKYRQSK